MPRVIKPLTALQVKNAKPQNKPYKLYDGGGLFLLVTPAGGKLWRLKYRQENGKEGLLSFGSYPAVSLEQARRKRDDENSKRHPETIRDKLPAPRRPRANPLPETPLQPLPNNGLISWAPR